MCEDRSSGGDRGGGGGREVIFVDDGSGAVLFLAFLLFFMTAIKQVPHHRATHARTHALGLTRSALGERGAEEPGKDLSVGSTAKSCTPASRMIYGAYF